MPPENDDKKLSDNDTSKPVNEGEWDPRKPEYVVTLRRWKRRVRAVASIGLALAAGTFLAAYARADSSVPEAKKPKAQDGRKGAGAGAKEKNKDKEKDKDKQKDKGQEKQKEKDKDKEKDKGKVDKEEHRKGMPVRDNLLE